MKVLLVCAAGMSTSILMKKLKKYVDEQGFELEIAATGVNHYKEECGGYDILLLGPQISYQKDNVAKGSGKPVMVIAPQDYGIANAANIFKEIHKILDK